MRGRRPIRRWLDDAGTGGDALGAILRGRGRGRELECWKRGAGAPQEARFQTHAASVAPTK